MRARRWAQTIPVPTCDTTVPADWALGEQLLEVCLWADCLGLRLRLLGRRGLPRACVFQQVQLQEVPGRGSPHHLAAIVYNSEAVGLHRLGGQE